jgi:hypothetical protein
MAYAFREGWIARDHVISTSALNVAPTEQ